MESILMGKRQFSFSIISSNGSVAWQQGSDMNATISVPVENGRYLVLLGGQGMNPLPPSLFLEQTGLTLRVRADLSDGEGLRIIGPDQPVTSTPHALSAEVARRALVADGVASGTVTHEMLSPSVKQDLNRTVTKSMLGSDVLSDLNRTSHPTDDPVLIYHHRPVERANPQIFKARDYSQPSGTRFDLWRADRHPAFSSEKESI
jgi:hypothetical protein